MLTAPWPAPAKLNRFLHILGRRADGYHSLQTVFQFIDHCDYLSFAVQPDSIISRQGKVAGVAATEDLVIQAAHLLQKACGVTQGAIITLDKRLPIGGGLGGGSSDAATTLVALNYYWRTGLTLEQLATLGLQLGADVPVFVQGFAAWGEGIGEQLTPIALDEPWFVVLIPPCSVSTHLIFNDSQLTRNSRPITIDDFMAGKAGNVCAAVVYRLYPEIAAAADWLSRFNKSSLTGTGACVFAPFRDRQTAQAVVKRLPPSVTGFVARGLNHSPLRERLQRERFSA
jgi:4-diphosphocytidyl-2-C-methyl-D-erythritol kinase